MAYTKIENGKVFFYDKNNTQILLLDFISSAENRSKINSHQFNSDGKGIHYPLSTELANGSKKFSGGDYKSFISAVIYYRIIAELLRKPQFHNILHVGEWSAIDEAVIEILPKFNEKNFLYVLNNSRPVQNFNNTKFIFTEGEKYFLLRDKFSIIIFSENNLPPPEIFLSAKNCGKIYFMCDITAVPEEIKSNAKIFELEGNLALFEVTASAALKKNIFFKTELGAVEAKKFEIAKIISQVPVAVQKINSAFEAEQCAALDKIIKSLTAAEKLLAEIFPYLSSDTVKQNLNMLKEFLIDYRLRINNKELQKISEVNFVRQYKILTEDMNQDF